MKKQEGIRIYPGIIHAGTIETYEDHRMAMAFTLIGLRVGDVKISNPNCCAKTFENYFKLIDTITKWFYTIYTRLFGDRISPSKTKEVPIEDNNKKTALP